MWVMCTMQELMHVDSVYLRELMHVGYVYQELMHVGSVYQEVHARRRMTINILCSVRV